VLVTVPVRGVDEAAASGPSMVGKGAANHTGEQLPSVCLTRGACIGAKPVGAFTEDAVCAKHGEPLGRAPSRSPTAKVLFALSRC
jgi:hypothetical protein